jgi:hypothetical protein
MSRNSHDSNIKMMIWAVEKKNGLKKKWGIDKLDKLVLFGFGK